MSKRENSDKYHNNEEIVKRNANIFLQNGKQVEERWLVTGQRSRGLKYEERSDWLTLPSSTVRLWNIREWVRLERKRFRGRIHSDLTPSFIHMHTHTHAQAPEIKHALPSLKRKQNQSFFFQRQRNSSLARIWECEKAAP